jgi:hypothetical protein
MHNKYTYLLIFSFIVLSSFTIIQTSVATIEFKLLSKQTEFDPGKDIVLKFSTSEESKPLLYCSNSYGATLVSPYLTGNILQYTIPENISKKTGVVNWKLLHNGVSLSGKFNINSIPQVDIMETYIGPPSIEAGGKDYTMLVVIPTDSFDNPIQTNTLVNAKHQFLNSNEVDEIFTKNLIAYKNIYSKKESGRMLVSSESLGTNSKEFTINVTAAIPTDFIISAKRPHDYADGNQMTTFSTSIIKDKQDNVVSDGTYITFLITTKRGNILKTSGTTINGIATSKIIHPYFEDSWDIKAYVDGMAESNTITLNFRKAFEDFEVNFFNSNRNITVGPLQSFMNQMIPDGLQVKLSIYKNNDLLESFSKTSYNGYVSFKLTPNMFKNDEYKIKIKTAGIEKTFVKKLW